jgi:4-hydroxy-3-polyprenylbenzoate decarboxylase
MRYTDLRDFIAQLERLGQLKRIKAEVDPHLEMTEICDRVLRAGGPAILFENPKGHSVPVLANLFGTPERVALGMGERRRLAGRAARGGQAAGLPQGARAAEGPQGRLGQAADLQAGAQHVAQDGVVGALPAGGEGGPRRGPRQPADPALLARRRGAADHLGPGRHPRPHKTRQNLGIYRQQVLGPNKVIMRWLAHRGGALDFRSTRRPTRASPSRWRWCWAATRRPSSAPSRRCPIRCPNTSSPACCAAPRPSW